MSTQMLSENDVRRIVGISGKQSKKVTWHTTQISVRQTLSLSEYIETVRNIIADCTVQDTYAFEFFDYAFRINIIESFSNVTLPSDADSLFLTAYSSDLFDTIYRYGNQSQIDSIKEITRYKIFGKV